MVMKNENLKELPYINYIMAKVYVMIVFSACDGIQGG